MQSEPTAAEVVDLTSQKLSDADRMVAVVNLLQSILQRRFTSLERCQVLNLVTNEFRRTGTVDMVAMTERFRLSSRPRP